ncbi:MAG: Ldh family oxidoreductase [Pseudorhodobacter sp.]
MADLRHASYEALEQYCKAVFLAVGADSATARDATRSMMHGSLHGVDSHGVRLMAHYIKALEGGRLNKAPKPSFRRLRPGSGLLEADDAQGARATYLAMDHAMEMARETGIAGVGIRNSSHFGPAGAYAKHAADNGFMAFVTCNSDSLVRLHDGAERFHGTNPISISAPSGEADPWLLDMATSAIPFNRVHLYASLGQALPHKVASDERGEDTIDPNMAAMLAPVGGEFGFKGAALGGVAELFSGILTGTKVSPDLDPMMDLDMGQPRGLGAFVMAIDPEGFIGAAIFREGIGHYLRLLRNSPAREGARVMAPGDREWAEAARRRREGIPLDPVTQEGFDAISKKYGIKPPY